MRPALLAACAALAFAAPAIAQPVDRDAVNRIIDQGTNHSEVAPTAQHLTDVIGSRLTNSPGMRAAEAWTQQRYRDWGLKNVRKEAFEFGRGWSIERASARMVTPRVIQLSAIPVAWTPATNGVLRAPVIVAPIRRERDFAKWRGKLAGKIVMITQPDEGSEPSEAPFQRLSSEELGKLDSFREPSFDPSASDRRARRVEFPRKLDAFLKAEGAVAVAKMSYRDAKLLHGEGYSFQVGETPTLPMMEIAAEDYRRLARLAKLGPAPELELESVVRFHDEDTNAYNIIAEIPGTDPRAGYVMAGAHLDSWVAGDGASDNAAGSVVVMEAARILAKLGVRPKRTIRFALWSGEEQGLLGSLNYIEQNLATRGSPGQPKLTGEALYFGWPQRWPIRTLPGYADLAAYFNLDNGSGKIRGIYAENNPAVVATFREWMAPFGPMGASNVVIQRTTGTDHVFLQSVGLPGFQFIQDPLDYDSRVHHTSIDTYDHLKPADLRQASIIMASFLLNAANADKPLPKPPLPTQPVDTNPFDYPVDEDE